MKHFTLIELLVVVGILGVLAAMVLPGYGDVIGDTQASGVTTEMKTIQDAFRRFSVDLTPQLRPDNDATNKKLEDIAKYGLWPLMVQHHPDAAVDITYPNFTTETNIGRRGQYLEAEGFVKIAANPGFAASGVFGQAEAADGTVSIPVIKDPYGGYYRVVCPENVPDGTLTPFQRLQKMVLVCTGPDMKLDTTPDSLVIDDGTPENHSRAGEIKAKGDDTVVRLMPLSTTWQ